MNKYFQKNGGSSFPYAEAPSSFCFFNTESFPDKTFSISSWCFNLRCICFVRPRLQPDPWLSWTLEHWSSNAQKLSSLSQAIRSQKMALILIWQQGSNSRIFILPWLENFRRQFSVEAVMSTDPTHIKVLMSKKWFPRKLSELWLVVGMQHGSTSSL